MGAGRRPARAGSALTAALLAAGALAGCGGADEPASSKGNPVETITPGTVSAVPLPPSDPSASDSPATAAQRAFEIWARNDVSYDEWWLALKPLLSLAGRQDFAYTDPANIPDLEVTGKPVQVKGRLPGGLVDEGTALVRVPTTLGAFGVYVSRASDTEPWLMLRLAFPAGVH